MKSNAELRAYYDGIIESQAAEITRLRERVEELEARCQDEHQRFLHFRCMEMGCGQGAVVCRDCGGAGRKMYGSTATWRGGIGGQAFTADICDCCWGSGWEDRPWISVRKHESLQRKYEALEERLEAKCQELDLTTPHLADELRAINPEGPEKEDE